MAVCNANNTRKSHDLPEQLRQICDALWAAADRKDIAAMHKLVDRREELLKALPPSAELTDRERRELLALQAADKYLLRQLAGELSWLEKRLQGVALRRSAALRYRGNGGTRSHLSRTG
ncbi:MAG: hypothetical protein IPG71_08670 [bacterium]|nr:hypothetical protein [bacterium]